MVTIMQAHTSGVSSPSKIKQFFVLPWIICGLAAFFYFYQYLLRVSPSIMSRELMSVYHLNARSYGNLSAIFYYIYAPMQILVGMLLDRYGTKRLMSLAVFACSMGVYLFASSHYLLVAETGRFLIGLGASFAFVGTLKLASMWLPTNRFALITGIAVAIGVAGGMVGDVTLAALVESHGWKLTCYLAACFGLILTMIIFILFSGKECVNKENVSSTTDFKFVWQGSLQLMKNPQFWLNGIIGCLMYLPITGFAESWEVPFFSQALHFTRAESAHAASMVFLGWAVGGPLLGWFSDKINQRCFPITLGATVAAILLSFILYVPEIPRSILFILLFIFGFFLSCQAIVFAIGRELSAPGLTGTAVALTNMIVMFAGLSVLAIGAMLDVVWAGKIVNGVPIYTIKHFQVALLFVPAALVIAVILSFFLRETHCRQESHGDNSISDTSGLRTNVQCMNVGFH